MLFHPVVHRGRSDPYIIVTIVYYYIAMLSRRGLGSESLWGMSDNVVNRTKIKLMNYLGGMLRVTCGWAVFIAESHPGSKGLIVLTYLEAYVCSHKLLWALAWLISCRDSYLVVSWMYMWIGGMGATGVRETLLKNHVSIFQLSYTMKCDKLQRRWSSLVRKSAQTSAECKN